MSWWFQTAVVLYGAGSLLTLVVYGTDKLAAKRGQTRVPERTLHSLEFFFGWPGAFVGQQVFKHKRAKRSYMLRYYLIVFLHLAAWIGLAIWWNRSGGE